MVPPHLPPPGGGTDTASSATSTGIGHGKGQSSVEIMGNASPNHQEIIATITSSALDPGGFVIKDQSSTDQALKGQASSVATSKPRLVRETSSSHAQQEAAVTPEGPPNSSMPSTTTRRDNGTTDSAGKAVDPTQAAHTGQAPVAPSPVPLRASSGDMFTALVEDMIDSPNVGQVDAWCKTVRQIFEDVYTSIPCKSEALPIERKRFPTLSEAEATSLLGLFEQVFVKEKGSSEEWNIMAKPITHELLTTKWAFKEIV